MLLSTIDIAIIIGVLLTALTIGFLAARTSKKSTTDYFLSGRNMPWWLLGISMVATTFSTDTPNLVTDIVRRNGIAGNWEWWVFLITGMLTVFIYAQLWRRSKLTTDLGFYELRYSGQGAKLLRGFRAVYLGFAFNVLAMSGVILAAMKISTLLFDVEPIWGVLVASIITLVFSLVGGLRGVIWTDFFLFFLAMIGSIGAAYYIIGLEDIGSLSTLFSHPNVIAKTSFFPSPKDANFLNLLIIPLAVQWWTAWYPGAEPGGGGYVAQRMLSAKNENHSMGATLFFNIAHYALRPWPWIIVALASLIIFPDLNSIQAGFCHVSSEQIQHDIAYPAMLSLLPKGLAGLIIASLLAAFMSTVSTHLNWGSSYLTIDFYTNLINPEASEKRKLVLGRAYIVLLLVVATFIALKVDSAKDIFDIILMFGAGSGLLFLLRWFWWRINIWSELTAMLVSGILAILFKFTPVGALLNSDYHFTAVALLTTIAWVGVTFLTKAESKVVLKRYYSIINPGPYLWSDTYKSEVSDQNKKSLNIPLALLLSTLSIIFVLSCLFLTGSILKNNDFVLINAVFALVSGTLCIVLWRKANNI